MNVEKRYESLAIADSADLESLADRILAGPADIVVVMGPEAVSTAIRFPVPGTGRTDAVLGHVAVTRCTVEIDGVRGDGMRRGRDLAGAVAAAVCDAECERGGPDAHQVERLCADAVATADSEARSRADLVGATRLGGAS